MPDGSRVYLLAAAVVAADQLGAIRGTDEHRQDRGQCKRHWHDEDDTRRMRGIMTIATLPALLIVVTHATTSERSERCRRLCLCRLLRELDMAGVAQMVLEQRQRRQDDADMKLLSGLRAANVVGSELRMRHASGADEPRLWWPDFVAGATGAALRGDARYFDQLTGLISIFEV